MGLRFPIRFANIVAYLTWETKINTPRIRRNDLIDFLEMLKNAASEIDTKGQDQILFSTDFIWRKEIREVADLKLKSLDSKPTNQENILRYLPMPRLKDLMSNFSLISLIIATPEEAKRAELDLRSIFENVSDAFPSMLFLFPDDLKDSSKGFSILDPFPQIEKVAQQVERLPGVLFWTPEGQIVLSPLEFARKFLNEINELGEKIKDTLHKRLEVLEEQIQITFSSSNQRTLLHLSDLHFGKKTAIKNQEYLIGHLNEVAPNTNRILITGDLFDNPKELDSQLFLNFRSSLQKLSGKNPVIIPGNHDQRFLGNFRLVGTLNELSKLDWGTLIVDDDAKCVFFCFDSAQQGNFARGKVSTDQLREMATLFMNEKIVKNEIKDYLRICLVHHHPFTFDATEEPVTGKKSMFWRFMEFWGIRQEAFLCMEDADEFVQWCADLDISLILHGHKHVQRHAQRTLSSKSTDGEYNITSIGCGTSLGAGSYPLSYNLITWNDVTKKWGIVFYADSNYGGFTPQKIAIHHV